MNDSADKLAFLDEQQRPGNRLLDRMDRALTSAGRAIWRYFVDGFAAYGAAECGLLLDPVSEHEAEIPDTPDHPSNYGAVWGENLPTDFADVDELIRAMQTAED